MLALQTTSVHAAHEGRHTGLKELLIAYSCTPTPVTHCLQIKATYRETSEQSKTLFPWKKDPQTFPDMTPHLNQFWHQWSPFALGHSGKCICLPCSDLPGEAGSLRNRGLRDTWLICPSSSTEAERHEQSQERTSDSRRVICNNIRDGFHIAC